MEICLGVAGEAIGVLSKSCSSMAQICSTLPTCSDSYVYRGKIRSLQDAAATTAGHVSLLLLGVTAECARKANNSADDVKAQTQKMQQVGDFGSFVLSD